MLIVLFYLFKGYDISFLITNAHTESMHKYKLVDFIIEFIETIDRYLSENILTFHARGRIVAQEYLKAFEG